MMPLPMDARSNARSLLRDTMLIVAPFLLVAGAALAHTVAEGDQAFVRNSAGVQILPFIYLGAKHMVTGYDHLAFLAGVIFFLYRLKEVALYVTLFAIGHSSTLLLGVLTGLHVNPFLIDAIIGLSVVYKALDNMDAFRTLTLIAATGAIRALKPDFGESGSGLRRLAGVASDVLQQDDEPLYPVNRRLPLFLTVGIDF